MCVRLRLGVMLGRAYNADLDLTRGRDRTGQHRPGAEGATRPESLRQKDRAVSHRLWRATPRI